MSEAWLPNLNLDSRYRKISHGSRGVGRGGAGIGRVRTPHPDLPGLSYSEVVGMIDCCLCLWPAGHSCNRCLKCCCMHCAYAAACIVLLEPDLPLCFRMLATVWRYCVARCWAPLDCACAIKALFSYHLINTINTKKIVTSNVLTHAWSIKWSLFTKLFVWMGCKSQDESNEPT